MKYDCPSLGHAPLVWMSRTISIIIIVVNIIQGCSPRHLEIKNLWGTAGQCWLQIPFIPLSYAHKLRLRGRKSRKIFSFVFVYILRLSSSQKYLLKVRGDNVFIYQNIIIHYKYLHNIIRTFVKFLDQSIYAFFCPAPPRRFSASPRPSPFIMTNGTYERRKIFCDTLPVYTFLTDK